MPEKQQFFTLQIDGVSAELRVVRFRGTEGISELFEFQVDFASDDPAIDFDAAVGKPAVLEMQTNDDPRIVHGIVSCIEEVGVGPKFTNYAATIVPALWTFGLRKDCCIYQAQNVPDVIKDILVSGGLESGTDFDIRLKASYPKMEYCVQYRESDLEFVTRLMEETGIFYFFEHTTDGHKLVLADDKGEHADISGPAVLAFRAVDTGMQSEVEEVTRLRYARSLRTGAVAMRSFNFEKTQLSLETTSKAGDDTDYVDYDFDGRYFSENSGKDLAKIKQEAYAVSRRTLSGTSNCRHFTAGFKFAVGEHPRDDCNGDYVLTKVSHAGVQPQAAGADGMGGASDEPAYSNTFEAIPADVTFRPQQVTERGLVEGPQTAVVTGPAGEEIHCDAHGRVKVKFHWDRYGKADDTASVWMRVGQSHRINDLAIPRVGEEVIVDFLEGDPDQPIITGRVYNGTKQSPYSLPGDKTKSTFKTLSSPGGDGFNELRFEDAAGSEEIYLHAQKDWNIEVLHDRTQSIGNDHTHTVGHDETMHVKNDRSRTVDGNETIKVIKDQTISITGNLTEAVEKNVALSVNGGATISVKKDVALSIDGGQTTAIAKDDTLSVGKNQSITIDGNKSETVSGSQTLSVTKASDQSFSDKVSVAITKDYGAEIKGTFTEKIGKSYKLEAADEIQLVCGSAKIIMKKSGDITIEGGKITVKASSDLTLKGSKVAAN